MKIKRFLYFIMSIFLVIMITGCSNNANQAGNKKINIGTNAEFPPFEYMDNDGNVDGFDVALMKEIGKAEGFDVEFTNMEFKSLTASLKTGSLDAVSSGMTITDERKQSVDFSDSYFKATQCIVLPKDSNISSIKELDGKRIAVQEGTTGDLLVTPNADNQTITNSSTVVKRFKKGSDAVLELKNGGVDAVVIDSNPAKNFAKLNSDTLKYVEDTTSSEEYGIAVQKGNQELLDQINDGLKKIKENGTYDQLVSKYISQEVETQKTNLNPISSFIDKFKNVFINTKGYMLLLKGLGTTLGITVVAAILGIILGFIIALMKMTEVKNGKKTILSIIADIYTSILRGTPVVVQLLIMYMVIFQSHYGIIVAMLTFGINSGAYVSENIRAGIMSLDKGQTEAGMSLGFSYGQTMKYIILPQAIKNSLPALGNEFIALVKETSIVGYVAIQDLTKAADFLISRTYETFLPLIAIALIYFVIIMLLTRLLRRMERRLRKSDNY